MLSNPWIPQTPTPKQALFLADPRREVFYGGAAGGAKSSALLMAALQYADQPGYNALLLRRTFADLALPGAIMDRSHAWLRGTAAHWNERDKTWTFPSGATLTFGYLQHSGDKFRYQGSELQFVGFDELTQFPQDDYLYLFSRLRRVKDSTIPIRMRAASNPGNIGHDWVYRRFILGGRSAFARRGYIPAKLEDNPHLDRDEYEQSLAELDPITREQLLNGVWVREMSDQPFRRSWWTSRNRYDADDTAFANHCVARFISWDTALEDKDDSAFTACVVGELSADYRLAIRETWRAKLQFPDLLPAIDRMTSKYLADGKLQAVVIENKASGTSAIQTLRATSSPEVALLLQAFQPSGSKVERAQQASAWCSVDSVLLPHPSQSVPWLREFEEELFGFPNSEHKDQVDAFDQLILYVEHLLAAGWEARRKGLTDGSAV